MHVIKIFYTNKNEGEIVFESPFKKNVNKWWDTNKEDYIHHPMYRDVLFTEVEYEYFTLQKGKYKGLFKVTKTNEASCIVKEMHKVGDKYVVNPNGKITQLVFSPLKGNAIKVTDEEIWDIMGLGRASKAERNARMRDFLSHRSYFDTPNDADDSTWHEPSDRVGTMAIWRPYVDFPKNI